MRRLSRSLALITGAVLLTAAAAAAADTLSDQALIGKLHWRNIGPYIGGRVVAVTGVASQPNLFYMGSVDGGIWKSTDYGVKWENISDNALPGSSDSIGAIAVAPSNPDVIYAGTGESDIRGDMITGDGVFKSTDAGKTWQYAGLRDTRTTTGIVVDPTDPDVVYVSSMGHVFQPGTHRGVFKSTDGGKTWHRILYVNSKTGAIDLVMDPNDPDTLYAAMWQAQRTPWSLTSGGPGSGLYKSTDGGAHWHDITRHAGLPRGVLGRIGITASKSHPGTLYTIMQAKDGGVFRSDDAGKTWRRVNDDMKLRQRAFYYMSIFVDPKDADTVYVPEVDALYVSRDAGKTFTRLKTPHGDNHILWINPDNTDVMLEGNDGGATVTTDGGKTWSPEHNQPTGQFYHINLDDQFPFHVYGAQQDEGSFEGPSATREQKIPLSAWHRVAYGESTFTVPEPGNPDVTYGSGYYSIFLKYNSKTEEYRSVSPWPHYQEGASAGELKYRLVWTHPILFSSARQNELLLGAQYVLKSTDHGNNWTRISPDLTRNDPATEAPSGGPIDLDQSGAELYPALSALAASPRDGDMIWAGSDDGLVHITTDGGKHWKKITPKGLPKWTRVSCIEPSHTDKGTAYLSARRYMWDDYKPYVYKTTDYGRHWKLITDGLPDDQYTFAIRQDPDDADLLFLTTRNTVYMSLNGGAHWQPLGLNLPHVQVRDLRINTRQGSVAIATHGRAFWILDNLHLLEQLTRPHSVASDSPALFAPDAAWLSHAYGKPDHPRKHADVGENPAFGAAVFFHIPANYHGDTPAKLTFTDTDGHVIRSFDLHKAKKQEKPKEPQPEKKPSERRKEALEKLTGIEPGMNAFQWDLRYTPATEVDGFEAPIAAGGLPDEVDGPVVVPGTYRVTLNYGGHAQSQTFQVKLDPRLDASQADLIARLKLQLAIHERLDTLDKTLNRAIAARDKLQAGVKAHQVSQARAAKLLAHLNDAINDLVQLNIHSSEGSLLHETRLRSHLAYLAADIGLAYTDPTPAQQAVYKQLAKQAREGEERLEDAIDQARNL